MHLPTALSYLSFWVTSRFNCRQHPCFMDNLTVVASSDSHPTSSLAALLPASAIDWKVWNWFQHSAWPDSQFKPSNPAPASNRSFSVNDFPHCRRRHLHRLIFRAIKKGFFILFRLFINADKRLERVGKKYVRRITNPTRSKFADDGRERLEKQRQPAPPLVILLIMLSSHVSNMLLFFQPFLPSHSARKNDKISFQN